MPIMHVDLIGLKKAVKWVCNQEDHPELIGGFHFSDTNKVVTSFIGLGSSSRGDRSTYCLCLKLSHRRTSTRFSLNKDPNSFFLIWVVVFVPFKCDNFYLQFSIVDGEGRRGLILYSICFQNSLRLISNRNQCIKNFGSDGSTEQGEMWITSIDSYIHSVFTRRSFWGFWMISTVMRKKVAVFWLFMRSFLWCREVGRDNMYSWWQWHFSFLFSRHHRRCPWSVTMHQMRRFRSGFYNFVAL